MPLSSHAWIQCYIQSDYRIIGLCITLTTSSHCEGLSCVSSSGTNMDSASGRYVWNVQPHTMVLLLQGPGPGKLYEAGVHNEQYGAAFLSNLAEFTHVKPFLTLYNYVAHTHMLITFDHFCS